MDEQFLKRSLDYRATREERHKEMSKDKLFKVAVKKIQTTMIGALSTLEESFGFLWGFENNQEKSDEQKEIFNIYEEARAKILDRGNTQIRNLESEFVNYDIVRKKHYINLPIAKTKEKTKMENKEKIVEGLDKDGNEVRVLLRQPTPQDYRDSQIEYNKAFTAALKSKAPLRQKIVSIMREQNIWDDDKQKQHDQLIAEISSCEDKLKGGGIRLSEAREVALSLREKRDEFRELLSEKNALDQNSAEGQADNARFSELIRLCMLDPNSKKPCFMDQKAYDSQAEQPWVIKAASELAGMIYGLDPDYDKNLEENKFLKEFNFVNEELDFINEDGHTVDSEGRLINEDGRYIAYRTEKAKQEKDQSKVYFVNREGEEVICKTNDKGEEEWIKISLAERKPFLDDSGKPIGGTPKKKTKATKKTTKKAEETA